MKCKNCGAELDENAKFCGNCGAKAAIEEAPVTNNIPEETTENQTTTESTEYIPHVEAEKVNPNSIGAEANDINTTLWIVLSIVNLVLCGSKLPGIVALIFSIIALVNKNQGNYEEAKSNLKIAKIAVIIGFILAVIVFILGLIGIIFSTGANILGF